MVKEIMNLETRDIILDYLQDDIISKEEFSDFLKAKKDSDFIQLVEKKLNLSTEKIMKIWRDIIYNHNGYYYKADDIDSFISSQSIAFLKLLLNKGIISRCECLGKYIKTDHFLESRDSGAVSELETEGMIKIIKLSGKIYYILDFKYYNEVILSE